MLGREGVLEMSMWTKSLGNIAFWLLHLDINSYLVISIWDVIYCYIWGVVFSHLFESDTKLDLWIKCTNKEADYVCG